MLFAVWCASKRLQLNPSKTEVIWFITNTNLKILQSVDLSFRIGVDIDTIAPVDAMHDLDVILMVTMAKHIAKMTSYYHLWRLKRVR